MQRNTPIYKVRPQEFIAAIRNYDVNEVQNLIARRPKRHTIHLLVKTFFQELRCSNFEQYINFCFGNITSMIQGYGIILIFWIDNEFSDILDELLSRKQTKNQAKTLLRFCLEKFSFDDSRGSISNIADLWREVDKSGHFPFRDDRKSPFTVFYADLQHLLDDLEISDQLSPQDKRNLCDEINELLDSEDFKNPDFNFLEQETAEYYKERMLKFLEDQEENNSGSYESEPRSSESEYDESESVYDEEDSRSYESEEEVSPFPFESRFRTSFNLKEILKEDEGLTTEYKDFFWKFNDKINLALSKTICGFLNRDGGRIYIGVHDRKEVVGIKLTAKERDEIKRHVLGLVKTFEPSSVNTSQLLSFVFLPIKEQTNHQKIPGLFVMKIIVKPGNSSELYSISKNECEYYQRNDAQNAKLTPAEVQKVFVERLKSPPKAIDENDFIDPQPESLVDLIIPTHGKGNYKKIPSPSKQKKGMNRKGKFNARATVHIKGLPKGIEAREAEGYLWLNDFQRDVAHLRIFHDRGFTNSGDAKVGFNSEMAAEHYANFVNSSLNGISAFLRR